MGYTHNRGFSATESGFAVGIKGSEVPVFTGTSLSDSGYNIGTLSSTAAVGRHLSATSPVVNSFCMDDNHTTLGAEVYIGTRNRVMLFHDVSACSIFATRGQLKLADTVDLATGVYAANQGYIELIGHSHVQSGAKVWGYDSCIEVPSGFVFNVDSGGYCAGLHAELTGAGTITNGGTLAGLYIDSSAATAVWPIGVKIAALGSTIGVDIGTSTTGLNFSGTYSGNAIDFSSGTYTPDASGSAGCTLIRAGSYTTPMTNSSAYQSGIIRLYMETSATGASYDRAIFTCLKTTGTKGLINIAGLAEVHADTASGSPTGPANVKGCEFITQLFDTGSRLPASSIMHAGWFKVTAIDGATINSTAKVSPIWLDNQLYGNNADGAIETTIWNTTGGNVPKGWAGFSTTSSGWHSLLYFDSTMTTGTSFTVAPLSTRATKSAASDASLIVDLNGTAYYIGLFNLANTQ